MKSCQCSKCQKEIIAGKFYKFFMGLKNGRRITEYQDCGYFCPLCAEKEKADDNAFGIYGENLFEVEYKIGDKTDEEILEFEEKWGKYMAYANDRKYLDNNLFINKKDSDKNALLNWCQQVRSELEPYLQKSEIVEKSWGGKAKDRGQREMYIHYLFSQSARKENYRKEVVEPTIAEILGVEKLNQEINTVTIGNEPGGGDGFTGGRLKLDNEDEVGYCWIDDKNDCRRIRFVFVNVKSALPAFCRALAIKEKELKGNNSPSQDNNSPDKDGPNPGKPDKPSKDKKDLTKEEKEQVKQYFLSNNIHFISLNSEKDTLIISYESNQNKNTKWKIEAEWTAEEKLIQNYLKENNKEILTHQEIENWGEMSNSTPTNQPSPPNWTLIISFSLAGIILLIGLIIFLRAKRIQKKKHPY